jgi:hypothetical protein
LPTIPELGTEKAGLISKNYLINPLYESNGIVFYRFVKFTNPTFAKKYNDSVYQMPKDIYVSAASPVYSRFKGFNVGAYSIPFRLRGMGSSNFDFESSLSLQSNLVLGLGSQYRKESWADFSIGIGLTGVNLTKKNSNVTEDRTASAFTISGGVLLKASKFANIGIFGGWDLLTQKDKDVKWIYDGQPWLGIGINISFQEITVGSTSGLSQKEPPKTETAKPN